MRPRLPRPLTGFAATSSVAVTIAFAVTGCVTPAYVTTPTLTGMAPEITIENRVGGDTAHHGDGAFRNTQRDPQGDATKPSGFEIATWIVTRRALPRLIGARERVITPVVTLDSDSLHEAPPVLRATWLGHATALVQTPDIAVLVDPVFAPIAGPLPIFGPDRRVALPATVAQLPPVDVVALSHDHFDHLDREAVRALAEAFDPVFLVPLGLRQYVERWGARRIVELDWWQSVDLPIGAGRHRFTATPAVHNSGRSLGGADRTLWAGWHMESRWADDVPALSVFYAGDTAYGGHFADVRRRLGVPDLTLMPIGAYEPRRFTGAFHVDPEEAIAAFLDLGGDDASASGRMPLLVPVHWGTFELTDEPMDEPPLRLAAAARAAGVAARIEVLPVGGSLALSGPLD